MVATTIEGGLGNQLFMYAAARALSLRLQTGLVLNTRLGFKDDWFHRNYELQEFDIAYKESRFLTFDYRGGNRLKNLSRCFGRNVLLPNYLYFCDKTLNKGIDERFFEVETKDIYIEGYWQSEKYFEDYKSILKDDLKFDNLKKSEILKCEEAELLSLTDKIPVCLCIRRYQECVKTPSFGVLDSSFYLNAMDMIANKLNKPPVFYVFTQDIGWALQNVCQNRHYSYKLVQEKRSVEDLYLMSLFHYHIISNSTFYWWGAWLADSEIVVSNRLFCNKNSNLGRWLVV